MADVFATADVAEVFGISAYEVREFAKSAKPSCRSETSLLLNADGIAALSRAMKLSKVEAAEKLARLGSLAEAGEVVSPSVASERGHEKKAAGESSGVVETEDMVVVRRCPNPTWVLAQKKDAAPGHEPVQVRVRDNRGMRDGQWMYGCKKLPDGRWSWQEPRGALIGRRSVRG